MARAQVDAALKMAHGIQSASSYTSIIAMSDLIVELFHCDADGYPMEGMWVSRLNRDGQINDLTVYMRPYPAVTVLRTRAKALAERTPAFSFLDEGHWELATSASATKFPRSPDELNFARLVRRRIARSRHDAERGSMPTVSTYPLSADAARSHDIGQDGRVVGGPEQGRTRGGDAPTHRHEHWPRQRSGVLDWLIHGTRQQRFLDGIFGDFCQRLRADGIPIARAVMQLRNTAPRGRL
jgi:hypothetical protein